jgi:hypothetical protein
VACGPKHTGWIESAETLMSQDEGSCPKNVKLVKA